jgi:hypothetical protein
VRCFSVIALDCLPMAGTCAPSDSIVYENLSFTPEAEVGEEQASTSAARQVNYSVEYSESGWIDPEYCVMDLYSLGPAGQHTR